jgi:RNA polymerase sigma-70 factor (ECF subfamily)
MAPNADLEALYDAHAQALYAYLLDLTRSEADTHDVMQEVFVKLARQPHLLDGVRDPRGFLLRLAHNQAIDQIRRQTTRQRYHDQLAETPDSLFAPATDPDEEMFRRTLAEALEELPEDQRAVVHLKLWVGLTFEKIAEILDLPPNTAASRYRYGLDKLRARLRPLHEALQS